MIRQMGVSCLLLQPTNATAVMDHDARKMRGERPFVFTNLKSQEGLNADEDFIIQAGMLDQGWTKS